MERITPSGGSGRGRSKREKEKIEKEKRSTGIFLDALEKTRTEKAGGITGGISFNENLSLEEMLDDIHESGEHLKEYPSISVVMEYKQAIRNFMHYVVQKSLEAETREGARFNPLKKQKRFTIVRIVDEKLERLAAGILQNQKHQLNLLKSIDEIYGLLVDLIS